ncbi:hypothetical protein J4G33_10100 [Actinotalea sp. BY-33]|uniref:Uncharacterized protein n=1 Tax=Actinotalea soli TaxID=2819234 RepID=A0A939RV88_9CELL|nr:hypothetical protein [Actinotalea soli]MBO1752155.1 hypothetical protein [Actinotalea soli]
MAVLVLAGCSSAPDISAQREDAVPLAAHVRGSLDDLASLINVDVVDDASVTVPCAEGGEHYRWLAVGRLPNPNPEADTVATDTVATDTQLDVAAQAVRGAVAQNPLGPDHLDQAWESTPTDEPVTRQIGWYSDSGDAQGSRLTADFIPVDGSSMLVRLEVATACG